MAEGESYRALEVENSKPNEEEEGEEEEEEESVGDEDDEEEEQKGTRGRFESELGELQSSEPAYEAKFRDTQLKALAEPSSVEISENGVQVNSTSHSIDETQSEKQNGISHHQEKEVLETGVAHVAETQAENRHQLTLYPTTSQEISPISVTQSVSYAASPTLQEKVNTSGVPEANQLDSSTHKKVSPITVMKTSASDGYNWRKYGQKQVKSPKGSRSYYRCTYSDCYAKKIECCDHLSHVTEIVYKSQHTHEPPIKNTCTKRSKYTSSSRQVLAHCLEENPSVTRNDLDPSASLKPLRETPALPERKRQNSINSDDCGDNHIKEEHVNEPEPKRRVKESNLDYSGSVTKAGKKTKLVVHAAGDVGISGDGYRWRKYGQKMVKGNPHPRNYYRCTSAGCPVRKHIETATDNTNAVIITYKGIHDHDMPVPKKRHGPHSAPLVAAAAPASMKNLQLKKTDPIQRKVTSTQWSVDNDGELTGEAMELGGEKAIESARTLLSIGFEIKPC